MNALDYFENAFHHNFRNDVKSLASLLEDKALALLGLGKEEEAIFTLEEALEHRQSDKPFSHIRYKLLADAPNPPSGVAKALSLLEKI